ncbi:class I SAM-dependent methyltransferase [Algoriphagus confluentis]|uniref:Class I SAM-dependent methyltransferase n=1 Tax=Algoriphagus confluentis TaxID=1697556 RepID=A0ABQ6PR50_9BACT|nr:class I SAM-dependent methyltransferase [Algoriphagus confluentis]
MKEFWNTRYQVDVYAYGKEPNRFLAQELSKLIPGKALFAAEGEGRNAVFAAKLGWQVTAFDFSVEAKKKAERLAKEAKVILDYQVASLEEFSSPSESFDLLVLIFAHFPEGKRRSFHQKLIQFLKPGGILILEGFSKDHLRFNTINEKAGGPKEESMLFSLEELKKDFEGMDFLIYEELETELEEGEFHSGQSAVVRIIAKKR